MKIYQKQMPCHKKHGLFSRPFTCYLHIIRVENGKCEQQKMYFTDNGQFYCAGFKTVTHPYSEQLLVDSGYELLTDEYQVRPK